MLLFIFSVCTLYTLKHLSYTILAFHAIAFPFHFLPKLKIPLCTCKICLVLFFAHFASPLLPLPYCNCTHCHWARQISANHSLTDQLNFFILPTVTGQYCWNFNSPEFMNFYSFLKFSTIVRYQDLHLKMSFWGFYPFFFGPSRHLLSCSKYFKNIFSGPLVGPNPVKV